MRGSPRESMHSERWQDPLGVALGRTETRGRLRGIGYGAKWKEHLPEFPEPAKMMRCKKQKSKHAIDAKVEDVVAHYLEKALSPLHPSTPLPPETERYTCGSPSPIGDNTVRAADSTK